MPERKIVMTKRDGLVFKGYIWDVERKQKVKK